MIQIRLSSNARPILTGDDFELAVKIHKFDVQKRTNLILTPTAPGSENNNRATQQFLRETAAKGEEGGSEQI